MEANARAHITFGIRGDQLDPSQVTSFLGLQPTHAFSRGQSYETSSGTRQRPFGVWQLRSEAAIRSLDLEEHAAFLLSQLEHLIDKINVFLSDPCYYVDIRIWWEFPSATGGYTISSDMLRRLAALCKDFNFTYIALGNEGDESGRK